MMCKWSMVLLMLASSLAWGRLDQPHQVEELAYGEVAYLYLQGDYFAALTRAQMALERGEVDVHRADLEVLLGAMYSICLDTATPEDLSTQLKRAPIGWNGISNGLQCRSSIAKTIDALSPHAVSIDSRDLRGIISPHRECLPRLMVGKFRTEQFEVGTKADGKGMGKFKKRR